MKLRSTLFLTMSLVVHAVCITALALSHFKGVESPNGNNVEVTMGEASKTEDGQKLTDSNEAKPVSQPEMKPIEKVEKPVVATKPAPKKPVAKKVAKVAKPVTELPPKEKVEQDPESLSSKIDDSTVEVAKEETPKFIPVKEKVEAQPADADEAEDKTEASSKDSQIEDPAPATQEEKPKTSGQLETDKPATVAAAGPLGQGGDTKGEAVSYLDLKQFSGNKGPEYPLAARKDGRQGTVDLLYRVTKDGRVAEVQVAKSSGHSDLDEAAVKAVAKFKFVPGQDGWAKQPVIFTLKGLATSLPSKLRTKSAGTE